MSTKTEFSHFFKFSFPVFLKFLVYFFSQSLCLFRAISLSRCLSVRIFLSLSLSISVSVKLWQPMSLTLCSNVSLSFAFKNSVRPFFLPFCLSLSMMVFLHVSLSSHNMCLSVSDFFRLSLSPYLILFVFLYSFLIICCLSIIHSVFLCLSSYSTETY